MVIAPCKVMHLEPNFGIEVHYAETRSTGAQNWKARIGGPLFDKGLGTTETVARFGLGSWH